ncbi:type IX secretion system membrane protein PorP/SprF [Flavobacterium sp. J27]|uniref:PorP/SprF family type IX secretion system membrane protein n=1 Tax=Flavobacterium sp. J27 TaxID=2060419 RepID=UPI001031644B|nr:type IX secretion system membrane protein PorP/SprF [Flavobacterium sp. J27]
MKKNYKIFIKTLPVVLFSLTFFITFGQQQPQYTQYMYNTISINSGYTGTSTNLEAVLLHRSQWVGIDGAPTTQSLGIHGKIGDYTGLGLSVINDKIGPQSQQYFNASFAYRIQLSESTTLSLGINGGMNLLNIDWSKGTYKMATDNAFNNNINNNIRLIFGTGGFLYHENWYVGLSIPNFIISESYDDIQESVIRRRTHYFVQGGYVFNVSPKIKFKPAFLAKIVEGSSVTYDGSLNFLLYEKLTLGAGYRFTDAVSGLVGFQITNSIFAGYAYDRSVTDLQKYNDGSHEIIFKFNLNGKAKLARSPRFF